MMHGWQSESVDGPTGGWSCVFLEWLQWLQWPPHPQLQDVVWRSVVQCNCSCSCSAAVLVV